MVMDVRRLRCLREGTGCGSDGWAEIDVGGILMV